MKKLLMMLALVLGLAACHGGSHTDRVSSFINLLNAQSAYDDTFYLVKHPNQTATEGFVVVYSATAGYVAYDIANYRSGDSWSTYSATALFQEVYVHDSYSDYWGEVFYVGYAYYNDWSSSYAGEFIFEQTEESFKDLEKVQALKSAYKVDKLGKHLSAEYGLSADRAEKVAKLVSNWETAGKKRTLTDADANAFSKELLGVSLSSAEKAYKEMLEGDKQSFESLIDVAAKTNGTSPEQMNSIINDFINQ